jgi:hypothetical protein
MYLLYVDESGRPTGRGDDHFVLAGVAVHEMDCYPFGQGLGAVQRRMLPPEHPDLEIHASRIISGRNEWSHVDEATRPALLDGVFDYISTWRSASGRGVLLFATVVHKRSFRGRSVIEVAYDQLLARFDSFLTRQHLQGDSHRSLVVADESSYEQFLQQSMPKWKAGVGTKKLHSLVEVPLFVDSRASRLIQAADCVAWATWNYYERGHSSYADRLHGLLDADDGVQHGLAHMVRDYQNCLCAACVSRVSHVIPASLAPWHGVQRPTA